MLFVQTASVVADGTGRPDDAAVPFVLTRAVVFVPIALVVDDESITEVLPGLKLVCVGLVLLVEIVPVVEEGAKPVVPPLFVPVLDKAVVGSALVALELEFTEVLLARLEEREVDNDERTVPLMLVPLTPVAVGIEEVLLVLVSLAKGAFDGCEEEPVADPPPVVNGTDLDSVELYPGPVMTATIEELTSQIEQISSPHVAVRSPT